jgi:hypothetical protein
MELFGIPTAPIGRRYGVTLAAIWSATWPPSLVMLVPHATTSMTTRDPRAVPLRHPAFSDCLGAPLHNLRRGALQRAIRQRDDEDRARADLLEDFVPPGFAAAEVFIEPNLLACPPRRGRQGLDGRPVLA